MLRYGVALRGVRLLMMVRSFSGADRRGVAEVDLMVLSVEGEALLSDELVQPRDVGS